MKALIIYYSYYGNTRQTAGAIAEGMQLEKNSVIKIDDLSKDALHGIRLLVVGSPTIGFYPSPSIVRWLDDLPLKALAGINVAAFDTRTRMNDQLPFVQKMFLSGYGYAATSIADALVKKDGRLITGPEGFFVQGTKGPLETGEAARAAAWGAKIRIFANQKASKPIRLKII